MCISSGVSGYYSNAMTGKERVSGERGYVCHPAHQILRNPNILSWRDCSAALACLITVDEKLL